MCFVETDSVWKSKYLLLSMKWWTVDDVQAEHKKRSKARKESQKPASRFEEDPKKRGLLNKYDEEEEEAAMLIGEQGQ